MSLPTEFFGELTLTFMIQSALPAYFTSHFAIRHGGCNDSKEYNTLSQLNPGRGDIIFSNKCSLA
jgi:hypothetical protein